VTPVTVQSLLSWQGKPSSACRNERGEYRFADLVGAGGGRTYFTGLFGAARRVVE